MFLEAFTTVVQGLPMSLLLTAVAFGIGLVVGIPLALALRVEFLPLHGVLRLIVDLLRGVPIIVWLFLFRWGPPTLHLGQITPLQAAFIGLGLVSGAYLGEIFRGAINAVPKGQIEAARALGIGRRATFFRIILPQAVKICLPSVVSYLIGLFKDTSIASTILTHEMVFYAQSFARQNPEIGILPYLFAGILYMAVSIPLAIWSRRLDRRLQEAGN